MWQEHTIPHVLVWASVVTKQGGRGSLSTQLRALLPLKYASHSPQQQASLCLEPLLLPLLLVDERAVTKRRAGTDVRSQSCWSYIIPEAA